MTPFKMSHTCAGWSKRLSLKHTSNRNRAFTLGVLKASHLYWTNDSIPRSQWKSADVINLNKDGYPEDCGTGHFVLHTQYKDVKLEVDEDWRERAGTCCCWYFKAAALRGRQPHGTCDRWISLHSPKGVLCKPICTLSTVVSKSPG